MYASLQNAAIEEQVNHLNEQHLGEIVREMIDRGLARDLYQVILEKCADHFPVCQDVPLELASSVEAQTRIVSKLLSWFSDPALEPLFFDANIDSSLTDGDIVERFDPARRVTRKCAEAVVLMFLDEFNTSSGTGLC